MNEWHCSGIVCINTAMTCDGQDARTARELLTVIPMNCPRWRIATRHEPRHGALLWLVTYRREAKQIPVKVCLKNDLVNLQLTWWWCCFSLTAWQTIFCFFVCTWNQCTGTRTHQLVTSTEISLAITPFTFSPTIIISVQAVSFKLNYFDVQFFFTFSHLPKWINSNRLKQSLMRTRLRLLKQVKSYLYWQVSLEWKCFAWHWTHEVSFTINQVLIWAMDWFACGN